MAKNNSIILKIEDLTVSYGKITAIRRASLEAKQGELVALIGANGAGKTSLIRSLLGAARPESGRIWFIGQEISRLPTDRIVASGISVVPEGRGILALMTVQENLELGAYHLKGPTNEIFNRVYERFPILAERKNQLAGTLSGGQQQMLAIGRALVSSPKLLVLDEPSLGLAPLMVSEIFRILLDLKKDGQTILLAEQNARKALQCADRAYVFETGNIVCAGTAQELAQNPRVQEAYLGGKTKRAYRSGH